MRSLIANKWQDIFVSILAYLLTALLGAANMPILALLASELIFTCVLRLSLNVKLQQAATKEVKNDIVGFLMGNAVSACCPIPFSGTVFCSVVFFLETKIKNNN